MFYGDVFELQFKGMLLPPLCSHRFCTFEPMTPSSDADDIGTDRRVALVLGDTVTVTHHRDRLVGSNRKAEPCVHATSFVDDGYDGEWRVMMRTQRSDDDH